MTASKINGPRPYVPIAASPPPDEVKAPKKQEAPPPPPPAPADGFEGNEVTTFGPQSTLQTDGRLSGKALYEQLPTDLTKKVSRDVWYALPEGQRGTLVATYQALKRYGVWDEVTRVVGEKEKREAHVTVGGHEAEVAGNSGDLQYEIRDPLQFEKKLTLLSNHFGTDGGVMSALHGGQISLREAGGQTSLHISLGPGRLMDAHIDRVNPVDAPKDGKTQVNPQRGVQHWSTEVLPEMIRKYLGVPGAIVNAQIGDGARNPQDGGAPSTEPARGEFRVGVNLEFHPTERTKPKVKNEPMEGSRDVPTDAISRITERVAASGITLPKPKGLAADSQPEAQELALALAAKIKQAVERGESGISIDLVAYSGLPGLQKPVVGDLRRLADIAREALKAAGVDAGPVTRLTVTFGTKTQGETVSLLHNGA